MISTRDLVARFWIWYEGASRNDRVKFDRLDDFGRTQHVDATAWTVIAPAEGSPESQWCAYPSGLIEQPNSDRMLRAHSRDVLYFLMAAFQSQAYAWSETNSLSRANNVSGRDVAGRPAGRPGPAPPARP